jgi:hypothetical protein
MRILEVQSIIAAIFKNYMLIGIKYLHFFFPLENARDLKTLRLRNHIQLLANNAINNWR